MACWFKGTCYTSTAKQLMVCLQMMLPEEACRERTEKEIGPKLSLRELLLRAKDEEAFSAATEKVVFASWNSCLYV